MAKKAASSHEPGVAELVQGILDDVQRLLHQQVDLIKQEVFPPLLHELLKGLASKAGERREFYPGGAASATIDPPRGQVSASGPDGRSRPITVDRARLKGNMPSPLATSSTAMAHPMCRGPTPPKPESARRCPGITAIR